MSTLTRELEEETRKAAKAIIRRHLGPEVTRPVQGMLRQHPSFGAITLAEIFGMDTVVANGKSEKGVRPKKTTRTAKSIVLNDEDRIRFDSKILMLVGKPKKNGTCVQDLIRETSSSFHQVRSSLQRHEERRRIKSRGNTTKMKFFVTKFAPTEAAFKAQEIAERGAAREKELEKKRVGPKPTPKAKAKSKPKAKAKSKPKAKAKSKPKSKSKPKANANGASS